jgi:hypothetical protein
MRGSDFGGEVGSLTLELAVLAPALLIVLAFVVAAGRVELAGGTIDAAARDAARAASTARTSLTDQHVDCRSLSVHVDTSAFGAPLGTPSSVRVAITCVVPLADIALPGLPGTKALRADCTSPVDPYRSRS